MRTQLLIFIAATGLIAARAAEAAESGQAATWAARKMVNFDPPVGPTKWTGPLTCDELVGELQSVLLDLGARASDLHVDARGCRAESNLNVDATFSVPVPSDKAGTNAAGAVAEARWQTVELKTGRADALGSRQGLTIERTCDYLQYVTKKILPLFSIRDAKEIPRPARPGARAAVAIGGCALASPLDDRPIRRAKLVRMFVTDRMLGGQRLIDLDAPARFLIDPGVAVLDLHPALENVLHDRRVIEVFVDAEVLVREIEGEIAHMAHG